MKHIKLFENFNGEKVMISIKFEIITDGKIIGKTIGISKDPKEAAIFALSAAENWIKRNGDFTVQSSGEALEILRDYFTQDELDLIISDLISGSIHPDFYGDTGAESDVSSSVESVPLNYPDGGYVIGAEIDGEQMIPRSISFKKI